MLVILSLLKLPKAGKMWSAPVEEKYSGKSRKYDSVKDKILQKTGKIGFPLDDKTRKS